MRRQLVQPNDPILIQMAEPIAESEITSPETQALIEEMLDVAYGHQEDRTKAVLVGLAAPQVGISKRIILIDTAADGKGNVGNLRAYVNPEVIKQSHTKEDWYEGCWSTAKVTGIVSRPKTIQIRAYTPEGKEVVEFHHGYTARIFQHEIDHLNGKEFVTHITNDNNLHWVEDDQWVEYRNNLAWRNWPHKCPREKWEQIKGIPKG